MRPREAEARSIKSNTIQDTRPALDQHAHEQRVFCTNVQLYTFIFFLPVYKNDGSRALGQVPPLNRDPIWVRRYRTLEAVDSEGSSNRSCR
jgi:hypothetical protein